MPSGPLPLFPVTTVGSWPRPPELLAAMGAHRRGEISAEALDRLADRAVEETLRLQEEAGVDLVTDGELRRDNFYSFVAGHLDGVRLMSLAEMLDHVEDKAGFEAILRTLDVPAFSIHNPTCTGRISRRRPLAAAEFEFTRRHTTRPVKVTLPGPYLLTRAMWVPEVTRAVYASKEELAGDVVAMLREETRELASAGAAFIQFDEPVLTELVFSPGHTRTFMCAALALRGDPAEELEFALSLLERVLASQTALPRTGLHVCRGNWSTNEETLLRGSYHPLRAWLERAPVDQLVLEYATSRAGELVPIPGKELGLGVVNPRVAAIEEPAAIRARVEQAARFYPPERIFLNPDCGFGTFSSRPMARSEDAVRKLRAMAEAARSLRATPPPRANLPESTAPRVDSRGAP